MQHELVAALALFAQLFVDVHLLPASEDFRLFLGKAGAHREFGLRQVQRFGIVAFICLGHRHVDPVVRALGPRHMSG